MNKTSRKISRCFAAVAALGLAAALTTACADDEETPTTPPAEGAGDDDSTDDDSQQDGQPTLDIVTPGDGEAVTVPFEVQVDTDVELGPVADEVHHLHVWFGDDQSDFDLYESATAQIDNAPHGDTTMWVQVHTFDHQPASDPVSVTLTIDGGNGSGGADEESGGGTYDY